MRRKYHLDENFFEKIDNEEKSYWFGFFCADGNASKNQRMISFAIKSSDKSHLEKLLISLKSNYPIKERIHNSSYGEHKICHLDIICKKMWNDITQHGEMKNKMERLIFPSEEKIPHELLHHFIRGYFDGDGCIYKDNKSFKLSIASPRPDFLKDIYNWMDLDRGSLIDKGLKSKLYFSGNCLTLTILNRLYNNSTIFLNRKYELYTELKSLFKDSSIINLKVSKENRLLQLHEAMLLYPNANQKQLAEYLNMHPSNLNKLIKELKQSGDVFYGDRFNRKIKSI